MRTENKQYLTYAAKYLGVALIAGSVVHIGTLDNGFTRYAILAVVGLIIMLAGNVVEALQTNQKINANYLVNIIGLSFATGFLSGGVQHYLDNPLYAGYLLGTGFLVSYVTYFRKEKMMLNTVNLVLVGVLSLMLVLSGHFITIGLLDSIHMEVSGIHEHLSFRTFE